MESTVFFFKLHFSSGMFQHMKKKKKKLFLCRHNSITLVVIDSVIVLFSSKSSCAVYRHGRFSSRCELHISTSFQRVKHWLKVSEHIFEMLALMGMLLVSFCSSRD